MSWTRLRLWLSPWCILQHWVNLAVLDSTETIQLQSWTALRRSSCCLGQSLYNLLDVLDSAESVPLLSWTTLRQSSFLSWTALRLIDRTFFCHLMCFFKRSKAINISTRSNQPFPTTLLFSSQQYVNSSKFNYSTIRLFNHE